MRKPPTGEPYTGKPSVRFGGRGGESLPYPYHVESHGGHMDCLVRLAALGSLAMTPERYARHCERSEAIVRP